MARVDSSMLAVPLFVVFIGTVGAILGTASGDQRRPQREEKERRSPPPYLLLTSGLSTTGCHAMILDLA